MKNKGLRYVTFVFDVFYKDFAMLPSIFKGKPRILLCYLRCWCQSRETERVERKKKSPYLFYNQDLIFIGVSAFVRVPAQTGPDFLDTVICLRRS